MGPWLPFFPVREISKPTAPIAGSYLRSKAEIEKKPWPAYSALPSSRPLLTGDLLFTCKPELNPGTWHGSGLPRPHSKLHFSPLIHSMRTCPTMARLRAEHLSGVSSVVCQ
jgi:hypothetical protein